MHQIKYPDYNNCITNLACSIAREFGLEVAGDSLHFFDEQLRKSYKSIVVILLDGMGMNILDGSLDPDGFFHRHLTREYSSVFPPTTVAATTSMDSGKNPSEHGWLGWDCYYGEIDKNVTVFLNTETGTDKQAADFPVAQTLRPYDSLVKRINGVRGQAYYATPYEEPCPSTFSEICHRIGELVKTDGKKYIYSYWNEPDQTIHMLGCNSIKTKEVLVDLEKQVQELCEKLEDTLVIVTADHGLIDTRGVAIQEFPKIMECFVRMPSIEPRALNMFVKEEMEGQFVTEFRKEFGNQFLLLSKEEIKSKGLFGPGDEHEKFDEMVGDYIAIATDDLSIFSSFEERDFFVGMHAGLTADEMTIPFIAIDTDLLGGGRRDKKYIHRDVFRNFSLPALHLGQ